MAVVFAVSQNCHLSLETVQFCCEIQTFFVRFLKSLLFEVELKKEITLITVQGVSKW